MKKFHLAIAVFFSLGVSAQNWVALPGVKPFHIASFYNDTTTGKLIACGAFDSAGSVLAQGIAQWNGITWGAVIPQLPYSNSILSVIRYGGDLMMSGGFYSWNSNESYIAKWNGTILDSLAVFNGSSPTGMLIYQNDLIIYGSIDTIKNANLHVNNVARWNGVSWSDLGFGAFDYDVNKMIVYHGNLYASATSSIDHQMYIFRLVNNNWHTVGQSFHGFGENLDLCVYNDELYTGGSFSVNDNPPSPGNGIAKLDTVTDTWTNVGGGLASVSIAPFVESYRMTVHNGALYTFGWFDRAGGAYAPYLAKWDGTQWCGFNVGFSYTMFSMTDYSNELYIGTGPVFDNDTSYGFVKWIGGNYVDTCGVITTGIIEQEQLNISVIEFPNPATTSATFQFQGMEGNKTLIIYDQLGKEIWRKEIKENEVEFSTENFSTGLYFYHVEQNGEIKATGKIVIE